MATDRPLVSHPGDGTAIVIDGDWLLAAAKRAGLEVDFRAFLLFLHEKFGENSQISLHTSIPEGDKRHEQFISSLARDGYHVVQGPSKGIDARLATHAMTVPARTLVLVSGDNDFIALLQGSSRAGRTTVLLTLPMATGPGLREAADCFVDLAGVLKKGPLNLPGNGPVSEEASGISAAAPPDASSARSGANLAPETGDGRTRTPAELLVWCESQIRLLADQVRKGGVWAVNHDPVIHRVGREADALARAFCPPALILSLPQVPITPPHVYDHHKALTVLHLVADWCHEQIALANPPHHDSSESAEGANRPPAGASAGAHTSPDPASPPGSLGPRSLELSAPSSLSTEACDRIVVVEDDSDETYLRWWMERLLPADQWSRFSSGVVFLSTEGRPTGDKVNQRLDTIIRTQPDGAELRPKAFVVADRDYKLDEELETERVRHATKPFVRQTWHVWTRVEIENYLLCPDAIVRYVMDVAGRSSRDPRFPAPSEADLRALVEEAIEKSRAAARIQLIDKFAGWKKGQALSTSVIEAENFLNGVWHGEERRRWCDAKEVVLPHLKGECKRRWNVAVSERELIRSLGEAEVPQEIRQVVGAIASFLSESYLLRLGGAEKEEIRDLVDALRSRSAAIRQTAAESLHRGGLAALPALSKALKDEDREVRRKASWSLACIGREAGPATPALTAALKDADPEVRRLAAAALGAIGPRAGRAVLSLITVLKEDTVTGPRQHAASALGRIGQAAEAVPALVMALTGADLDVRVPSAEALGNLGPAASAAIPALLSAVREVGERREALRQHSAMALGQIGQATPGVIEALAATLKDAHLGPRRFAARGLGHLGPGAHAAVTALTAALDDEDALVREDATEALGRIGGVITEIVPPLLGRCADSSFQVRAKAAHALGQLGPAADIAAATLEKLAGEDPSGAVRVAAAVALERITGDAERSIRILCGQLTDPDTEAPVAAANALLAMGPAAASAVPALAAALNQGHFRARVAIADTLGNLGSAAAPAVSALTAAFLAVYPESGVIGTMTWQNGPAYDLVRYLAAVALGRIGLGAREALPALREASRYRQAVRAAADAAIQHIEHPMEPAET